jgi:hypothetical protein
VTEPTIPARLSRGAVRDLLVTAAADLEELVDDMDGNQYQEPFATIGDDIRTADSAVRRALQDLA